jgi:hypothetical protein
LLPDEYIVGDNKNLRDTTCEIQVCSLLAHAFNEIEHDLQYKPKSGEISDEEKELLDQLGLITKSGDITIKHILDAADERLKEKSGDFDDVHDFVIRMREQLKLGKSFSSNAGQLYDEFRNMNLTSPQAIISELFSGSESIIDVSNSEYSKLKDFLPKYNPDITLDDDSSDILLCSFLRISYKKIIENHPTGRGKGRPSRLLSIAKAYKEMIEQK